MGETLNDIGVIGLAVMGRNLVLNIADRGFAVAAYNRTASVTEAFAATLQPGQRVLPCYSLEQMAASLIRPRRVLVMVKAGPAVDAVIDQLQELLEPGDTLVDGGNSHFEDTERRVALLAARGIHYLGMGISGGELGARTGPSLMPGGALEAYAAVNGILEAIAARVDGAPCVAYVGKGAAGHYVKMVHNGIEYGFMQLIAESYSLLRQGLGLSNEQLAEVYAGWSEGELDSYLVEITAKIFRRRDDKTGGRLIDVIRGEAGQLGTGMWTSQSAMDLQVPVPNIDAAVSMRSLSRLTGARGGVPGAGPSAVEGLEVDDVRRALYAGMVITYAQGFSQLRVASAALGYDLHLERVAAIWRGGCIIRARLLQDIEVALGKRPELPNLLLDSGLARAVDGRRGHLARAVAAGAGAGIPVPGLMAALSYLDAYRAQWLPFNLIQAQRDYFGAHQYQRVDDDRFVHTDWLADQEEM